MKLRIGFLAGCMVLASYPCTARAQPYVSPPVAVQPSSGPERGVSYVIDPTHTFMIYEIGHYGTTTNRGRFSTREGRVSIDPSGEGGSVDIVIDMSSINTGVNLLDRHVQSKDFFNVAQFPDGRFQASNMVLQDGKVRSVHGTLTLLGKPVPVDLSARRFNCYLNPLARRQVCGGDFEAHVRRSDWGITWGINFGFEDNVRILVQIEAIAVD
jgi:polyisoprenoid-binding protein YceI